MESAQTAQTSIVWKNDSPAWDFSQTTAFPMQLRLKTADPDNMPVVYVYLTPYKPEELKEILRKAISGYRREKRDVEIVREDKSIYKPLFDNHFVKLGNATGTPEQQAQFFEREGHLKPEIVEHSFAGLRLKDAESKVDSVPEVFDIFAVADTAGSTSVYQDIYDGSTDKVVRVQMVHTYGQPTEKQYREYRSARSNKFIRKSQTWAVTEDHSALERLYDAVIQSISGAAVNGAECTAANKATWIGSVPLWHKLFIVDQIFSEIVEKND